MASRKPFPHADFLSRLEHPGDSRSLLTGLPLSPLLSGMLRVDGTGERTRACGQLILLLKAKKAVWQASLDTELAADELRRYQKFAKPGQPSPHIVQLRQRQAAARQASSVSRQAFIKAATAFVREAGIEVPPRVAIEMFIGSWIEGNIPTDAVLAVHVVRRDR